MGKNNDQSNSQSKKENLKQGFFKAHKNEFKKITWPTKKVLLKQTITVIIMCIIVGTIIFAYDVLINIGLEKLIGIMS